MSDSSLYCTSCCRFCYPRGRRHHNVVPRVAQPLLLLSRTFYERSNSGYAMKPKKKKNSKTTNRHQNAVEYIAGKSFLFISFKNKNHFVNFTGATFVNHLHRQHLLILNHVHLILTASNSQRK